MGRITSRGCARNYWITLDFVSCDPMFLAQPLDVIRPIRPSYLSNNVYVSFLDLCRLSYFEVKTSLNKPLSQSGFFLVCLFQASLPWFFSPGTTASCHKLKKGSDRYAGMTSSCPVYGSETHIKPHNFFLEFLAVQWSRGVRC